MTRAKPGTVYLVGAGPGDPGLITVRGRALLGSADVVLHDELVHPALLLEARADADVRNVGKRGDTPSDKQNKQDEIDRALVAEAKARRSVVRLKGGDPFLFGRGAEEARVLVAAGVPFEVVPGVSSPVGAAAYAGISLTHRDFASSVTFVGATTRAGRPFDWSELARVSGTLCIFMGIRRITEIAGELVRVGGRTPETPVAVIQWGTWTRQRVVEATLADVAARASEAGIGSPGLIVVGDAVRAREHLRWFNRLPLFGRRVLVTRAEGPAHAVAAHLRSRGAEAVVVSTITFRAPPHPDRVDEAVRALGHPGYDVVAFTSETGIDWFWRALDGAGKDARHFGAAAIAAIGAGTAQTLAARGVRADVVPREFVGERFGDAVLEHLARRGPTPARVLLPRALVARPVLPDALRAAGHHVDDVAVYETMPAPDAAEHLAAELAHGIDVVLFTSGSTVDNLCDALGPDAPARLASTLVASIGPVTTAAATRRGLTVGVTASTATLEGLIQAVEHHFKGTESPPRRQDAK